MVTQTQGMVSLTNTTVIKFNKGLFMGGSIWPDQRACACGGKWTKQTFRKQRYFVCSDCDTEPKYFVLRKYLPIPGQRGRPVPIRYDQSGRRFTSIALAESARELINTLILTGKFDYTDFMGKEGRAAHLFSNFITGKYLPYYELQLKNGLYKPSSMAAKKQYIKNHLMPKFGDVTLKNITKGAINDFYGTSTASPRMKDLIAQELKRILNYAKEIDLISEVPKFPKQKKAKLKDAEKFLTYDDQLKVLDRIDDDRYRTMISILCYIPIRPSEIRALKWSDLDFKNGTLWIRRHVTIRSIVVDGRKSNDDKHTLPITPELMSIIESLPRPIYQDEYMFKGDRQEIISEHCLSRAWAKAIKLAGLPYVDLYRGTKSSRMSQMLRSGYSKSDIAAVAGVSEEVVGRYAQHDDASTRLTQIRLLKRAEG